MESQVFWDILSTPDKNRERWTIKRCTDVEKHLKRGKGYDQHRKLELTPPEKKITKNDELETVEHLHGKSPDKNIERKEWRDFPQIKGYMIKKSESLKKKSGRARKQRQLGDRWNGYRWENFELISQMLKWSDPLEEKHTGWKELTWQSRWSKGLVLP